MVFKLQKDLNYILERSVYEQQMAISNMVFMLSQHFNDKTDDFLSSEIYKKLSEKLIITTITQWTYETEIVKQFFDKEIVKYNIDTKRKILIVENKNE